MNTESTENKAAENFITLVGGILIPVLVQKPDSHEFERETVFLRQLPMRLYPELLGCIHRKHEIGKVALLIMRNGNPDKEGTPVYTKPADEKWVGSLAPQSHVTIIQEGTKLNKSFFDDWFERQKQDEAMTPKPDIEEFSKYVKVLEKANPELLDQAIKKVAATLQNTAPSSP